MERKSSLPRGDEANSVTPPTESLSLHERAVAYFSGNKSRDPSKDIVRQYVEDTGYSPDDPAQLQKELQEYTSSLPTQIIKEEAHLASSLFSLEEFLRTNNLVTQSLGSIAIQSHNSR